MSLGGAREMTGGDDAAVQGAGAHILIVDDQGDIRRAVGDVLADEGYRVTLAEDGAAALKLLGSETFHVVLLDIWLPGTDGIEVLTAIRAQYPNLPVVMMSGHATIQMAMNAIKLGAKDFLEKPLDLDQIVNTVKRVLQSEQSASQVTFDPAEALEHQASSPLTLERLVFGQHEAAGNGSVVVAGDRCAQRTLARSILLYGTGLHSGTKSGLVLEPLPANSGIHFSSISRNEVLPAHVSVVSSTGFATTLSRGASAFSTIEHLMSAFAAYGLTNMLVKCEGEVPVLDGSSREYCRLFEEVGIVEQAESVAAIKIDRELKIEGKKGEYIKIEPGEGFSVDYLLRYPAPVGEQRASFTLRAPGAVPPNSTGYRDIIAPCRTFGFVKDIGFLQRQGYAQGGRFDNFVLFGEEGAINGELRFPDEPARHKILDAIGDLYLLGRPLQGKVTACMTGHSDNVALLKLVAETYGL